MKILSVMDPLDRISSPQDTTIGFLNSAAERGHELWICTPEDLSVIAQQTWAQAKRIHIPRPDHVEVVAMKKIDLSTYDCVWMRKDPPVDQPFLHATYLLDYAHTWVINPPHQLRASNEKLYALHFPQDTPPTRLSANIQQILSWLEESQEPLIVKPLDGYGGLGIFLLNRGDRNARSTLELLTDDSRRVMVVQKYLPSARVGDKRVLLINGAVIGAILRTPRPDDHRGNIHVGGQVSATDLTPKELELCQRVGDRLKEDGIFFAGLDLIGELLTEVNITSPTGIRELLDLGGINAGDLFIEAIERQVSADQEYY